MKTLIIAGALIILACILYFAFRDTGSKGKEGDRSQDVLDQYFIATAPESEARARRALPDQPSEDVSNLLVRPSLAVRTDEKTLDYLPDPSTDWALFARFEERRPLDRAELLEIINKDWRQLHGSPQLYGKAVDDGHWTYLISADAPDSFSELAFGWRLGPGFEDSWQPVTARELQQYHESLSSLLSQFGVPVITPSLAPPEAARRSRELQELVASCDRSAIILLTAPESAPYDGKVVWDVMLSLGLSWGDMDLFHWLNDSSFGDDSLFSVWTSTQPGYFLPEAVASGVVFPKDLVFGYSIPRSAAPEAVFRSMVAAAQYAQRRLGGSLSDALGNSLDEDAAIQEIASVVEKLEASGFKPGRGSTLYLF